MADYSALRGLPLERRKDILSKLLEKVESNGGYFLESPDYAEPGYHKSDDDMPILFSDFNDNSPQWEAIEACGCELEWEDEWTQCSACGRAVRTSPDCYSWLPSYSVTGECDIMCHECIKDDPEGSGYLEELINNPRKSDTLGLDFGEHGGFKKLDKEYETGMHPGQSGDPNAVYRELKSVYGGASEAVFQVVNKGQFDLRWVA